MKKFNPVLFALLVVLFTGCSGMTVNQKIQAEFWATQNAESGVIPPAEYLTLAATALNLRLTATPQGTATPNAAWTPTMNFFDYSATQAAQVQNNAMTAQVQQQEFELKKLQAEQEAEQARIVAQQHSDQMTSQAAAIALQSTQSAEGTRVANTAIAQATATERAFVMSNNATGTAAVETAMVQPTMDIMTLQAARIMQTVEAGDAEKVALSVRRQTMKNTFDAFLPWTLIIALAYVFGRGFATWVKTRTHPRDEHGRPQTFTRELSDGGIVMVRPEQLETGIVKVTGAGEVIRYAPMDKTEQSDINRRTQAVEAIAALPMPYAQKGPQLLGTEFGRQTPRVNFHDLKDSTLSPVMDEADSKFLENNDE